MSNKAYLYATNAPEIYPHWQPPEGEVPSTQLIGFVDGCIALMWLLLFSADDWQQQTLVDDNGQHWPLAAPLVRCETARTRLQSRRAWVCQLFADNGGLDGHIDAFAAYLDSLPPHVYWGLDIFELQWLDGDFEQLPRQLQALLVQLDQADPAAKDGLVELSTVMTDRPFLPWPQAYRHEPEDRWNLFRIMGDTDQPAAWLYFNGVPENG